jgi:hypothetical protein
MKGDCVEVDSGTLTRFHDYCASPKVEKCRAGKNEGDNQQWKRTLHRQAQLIPHARKQLQVCTKCSAQKKAQRRIGGVVTGPGGTEDIPHSEFEEPC